MTATVALLGAGVIGLATGWRLAQAGFQVTLFDQGEAGHGATWAAAGMLAPQVEAEPGEESLLPVLLRGRELWPAFAADLEATTGLPVGYRSDGTLVVATNADEQRRIQHLLAYQQGVGLNVNWLNAYQTRKREPRLSPNIKGAVCSPDDHQVDNRRLVPALKAAFLKAGGVLHEHTAVAGLLEHQGRVTGIRLACGERLFYRHTLITAGAWARKLAEKLTGVPERTLPVRPVKGQMLALQMPPEAPLIQHVIWGEEVYLVPRDDGRLLIGATVEEQGFNTTVTAGGLMNLLRHAWELLPGIHDLPVIETWAGLRPGSPDDAPILGAGPLPGLWFATGHYRNGILLAPLTAAALTTALTTGDLPDVCRHLTWARFHSK